MQHLNRRTKAGWVLGAGLLVGGGVGGAAVLADDGDPTEASATPTPPGPGVTDIVTDPAGDVGEYLGEAPLVRPERADLREVRYEERDDRLVVTASVGDVEPPVAGVGISISTGARLDGTHRVLDLRFRQSGAGRVTASAVVTDFVVESTRQVCRGEVEGRALPDTDQWQVSVPLACVRRLDGDGVLRGVRTSSEVWDESSPDGTAVAMTDRVAAVRLSLG